MDDMRTLGRILGKDGWERDYYQAATQHNCSTSQWSRRFEDRILEVQLWGDNGHRVSRNSLSGSGSEVPTEFGPDREAMAQAIEHELHAQPVYRPLVRGEDGRWQKEGEEPH